eukprot:scaffold229906_cov39-Prasinocladus_malaysianus.AAC.2
MLQVQRLKSNNPPTDHRSFRYRHARPGAWRLNAGKSLNAWRLLSGLSLCHGRNELHAQPQAHHAQQVRVSQSLIQLTSRNLSGSDLNTLLDETSSRVRFVLV